MQKITPSLWFSDNAEDAVRFYSGVFKDVKILDVSKHPEDGRGPAGSVLAIRFEMMGQEFVALNGGPMFEFNEAVSFIVTCADQDEVDYYWERLVDGGEESMCGWLKDRFGLSWQVVPAGFTRLITGEPAASKRVMESMMKMRKLDIAVLEQAYKGS